MSIYDLWERYLNISPGVVAICLRLLCAMFVGALIGIEREYTHRPAGLRTHILVALGACVVSITGEMIFHHYGALGATPDPARLSAQVVTGVGFLGAGTIMKEGASVKGLTTAASVWAVACLGIAAGGGYYLVALAGTVLMFITLTLLEVLQNAMLKGSKRSNKDFVVIAESASLGVNTINHLADSTSCHISSVVIEDVPEGAKISFHTEFGAGGRKRREQRFIDCMTTTPGIHSIKEVEEPAPV
jgi:putative Mg2+ transporter-C (MgtC) family protein